MRMEDTRAWVEDPTDAGIQGTINPPQPQQAAERKPNKKQHKLGSSARLGNLIDGLADALLRLGADLAVLLPVLASKVFGSAL